MYQKASIIKVGNEKYIITSQHIRQYDYVYYEGNIIYCLPKFTAAYYDSLKAPRVIACTDKRLALLNWRMPTSAQLGNRRSIFVKMDDETNLITSNDGKLIWKPSN